MLAFVGCLEASIRGFRHQFLVTDNEDKVTFMPFESKPSFSFDVMGTYRTPSSSTEVFLECKGYTEDSGLFVKYKRFVAQAYLTSALFARHNSDHFWFVCNVPFACSRGRKITTHSELLSILTQPDDNVRALLGDIKIDNERVRLLPNKIAVFILTDEYMKAMGVPYTVKEGDNIESIIYDLHGHRMDFSTLSKYYSELQAANEGIKDLNHIEPGWTLKMPWFGVP